MAFLRDLWFLVVHYWTWGYHRGSETMHPMLNKITVKVLKNWCFSKKYLLSVSSCNIIADFHWKEFDVLKSRSNCGSSCPGSVYVTVIAEREGNLGQSTSVSANNNSSSSSVRENKSQVSSQDAMLNTAKKPTTNVIRAYFGCMD